jgi:hypothetical protein
VDNIVGHGEPLIPQKEGVSGAAVMRGASSSGPAARIRGRVRALVRCIFSTVVFELRLGVERLRRRRGDHRGRGRGGASGESGKNCAGDKDAKVSGHLRVLPVPSGARTRPEWRSQNRRKARLAPLPLLRGILFTAVGAPSGDHRDRGYMLN